MNNELNKHKSSDKIKWVLTLIAFLLVGATLAGILLGFLAPKVRTEEPIKQEQEASVSNGGYETEFVNTEFVKLYSASPMMYSRQTATAIKKVYATVMPETATFILPGVPLPQISKRALVFFVPLLAQR